MGTRDAASPLLRLAPVGAAAALLIAVACTTELRSDVSRMPVDDEGRQPLRVGTLVKKRQIAPVMAAAHADWLTRPGRDEQEQPDRVVAELGLAPDAVVADLGAGVGYFTWRLAKAVPQGKVIAVDIQPEMIERLRKNLSERGVTNVEIVLGSQEDPKLPERSVDLVLLVDVYHELQQPEYTMERVRRSLKPEGRVAIIEYRKEDPQVMIAPLHKMTAREVRAEVEPMGFEFDELMSFLPTQHILVFKLAR